jgi:hypothetical protein
LVSFPKNTETTLLTQPEEPWQDIPVKQAPKKEKPKGPTKLTKAQRRNLLRKQAKLRAKEEAEKEGKKEDSSEEKKVENLLVAEKFGIVEPAAKPEKEKEPKVVAVPVHSLMTKKLRKHKDKNIFDALAKKQLLNEEEKREQVVEQPTTTTSNEKKKKKKKKNKAQKKETESEEPKQKEAQPNPASKQPSESKASPTVTTPAKKEEAAEKVESKPIRSTNPPESTNSKKPVPPPGLHTGKAVLPSPPGISPKKINSTKTANGEAEKKSSYVIPARRNNTSG